MGSFAFDSYYYQDGAVRLTEILREEGVGAWLTAGEPLHVKLISVEFLLLGPLFGHSILSAEPLNLLAYLAIVALVLALGRELGGPRVGRFSAVAVAMWPTFLLHSLQLLKDPLFIAGGLALVLCVTTWLTRTYDRRDAVRSGALTAATITLLLLIRPNFGVAVLALVLLGSVLLVARQLRERRLLYWNMACPLLLILAVGALIPLLALHTNQKYKRYPSDEGGLSKADPGPGLHVPTVLTYRPPVQPREGAPLPFAAADRGAQEISRLRYKFAASYPDSGSIIDRGVEFRDSGDLILYLPRAFAIGYWAPFPDTWAAAGLRVGSAGRLLAGAETLAIYFCQALALLAVLRGPRRLASWLLLSVTTFGVTGLGLVVPNVGAIYRFRYVFWVLLIVLGMKGLEIVITSTGRWLRRRRGVEKRATAALVLLACLLATGCSRAPGADSSGGLGLTVNNYTGSLIRAIHLSPSGSAGWEENVLGGEVLANRETVDIRFSPEERAALWDLRVEDMGGHIAEWKRLALHEISSIRLFLSPSGERVVVAEVE